MLPVITLITKDGNVYRDVNPNALPAEGTWAREAVDLVVTELAPDGDTERDQLKEKLMRTFAQSNGQMIFTEGNQQLGSFVSGDKTQIEHRNKIASTEPESITERIRQLRALAISQHDDSCLASFYSQYIDEVPAYQIRFNALSYPSAKILSAQNPSEFKLIEPSDVAISLNFTPAQVALFYIEDEEADSSIQRRPLISKTCPPIDRFSDSPSINKKTASFTSLHELMHAAVAAGHYLSTKDTQSYRAYDPMLYYKDTLVKTRVFDLLQNVEKDFYAGTTLLTAGTVNSYTIRCAPLQIHNEILAFTTEDYFDRNEKLSPLMAEFIRHIVAYDLDLILDKDETGRRRLLDALDDEMAFLVTPAGQEITRLKSMLDTSTIPRTGLGAFMGQTIDRLKSKFNIGPTPEKLREIRSGLPALVGQALQEIIRDLKETKPTQAIPLNYITPAFSVPKAA